LLPNNGLPDLFRKLLEHQGLSLFLQRIFDPAIHKPETALILSPCGQSEFAVILDAEGAKFLPE
jgi:hypothetical protein